ncbi:MAG TPA: hypothetical protein DD827_09435 [Gammaproteobacteria bacterium]|nr:hypothetical protein [Gammaproteobacteria bacterium]
MPNNANSSSDFAGVNIAMMTVSDSHTEETDSSGKLASGGAHHRSRSQLSKLKSCPVSKRDNQTLL